MRWKRGVKESRAEVKEAWRESVTIAMGGRAERTGGGGGAESK